MRLKARSIGAPPYTAVVAAATAVALLSAWHSGGHVWRRLDTDYRTYSAYTETQRRHAFIDAVPLPSDVFDFYADRLDPGDRVYFLVMPSGFGRFFTLSGIVAAVGRFYFLPAVQVGDFHDASVVVSFQRDPNGLPVRYLSEDRAGEQDYYVARILTP